MKKVTFFVFAMILSFGVQAQENIAKLGLGSLLNRTINLEYERVLSDKNSVFAEIGISIPYNLNQRIIDLVGVEGGQNGIDVTSGKVSSFYFVAEYRFYTKGEGAKGFYVAPYLKLANNSIDVEGLYNNSDNNLINVATSIEAGLFSASLGGGIGYQWLINDKIAINWNFIGMGLSVNTVSAKFTAEDNNVFEAWAQDVREFLNDIPQGDNIEVVSDNSTRVIDGAGTVLFAGFRTGLSIGYIF